MANEVNMKNHLIHHYMLTISACIVAFIGLLIMKSFTGYTVMDSTDCPMCSKITLAIVLVLGMIVFFERTHHE